RSTHATVFVLANAERRNFSMWLLSRLLNILADKIDNLGSCLKHFLFEPFSVLTYVKSRMIFHYLHCVGKELFILRKSVEGLPHSRDRRWRRTRRHKSYPGEIPAGKVRRF